MVTKRALTKFVNGLLGAGTSRRATACPGPKVGHGRIWEVRKKRHGLDGVVPHKASKAPHATLIQPTTTKP